MFSLPTGPMGFLKSPKGVTAWPYGPTAIVSKLVVPRHDFMSVLTLYRRLNAVFLGPLSALSIWHQPFGFFGMFLKKIAGVIDYAIFKPHRVAVGSAVLIADLLLASTTANNVAFSSWALTAMPRRLDVCFRRHQVPHSITNVEDIKPHVVRYHWFIPINYFIG